MSKAVFTLLFAASALLAQHKAEPAGAPPGTLAAAFAGPLAKTGVKIINPDSSVFCEMWFVAKLPSGASSEPNQTLATVPHGALLGVINFPAKGADRRGQSLNPGLYTMRFSLFPVNGDHQGVAPQRDFLVLSPVAVDTDAASTPAFDPLMDMSRKASRAPHPAVLSIWKADSDFKPGLHKEGAEDWVLHVKIGDTPVAIIVIGKAEG